MTQSIAIQTSGPQAGAGDVAIQTSGPGAGAGWDIAIQTEAEAEA